MLLLILLAYLLSLQSQRLEITIQSLVITIQSLAITITGIMILIEQSSTEPGALSMASKGHVINYGYAVLGNGNNVMLDKTDAIHSCNTIISLDLSLDLQPLRSTSPYSVKLPLQFTSTNPPVPSGISPLFARTNSVNALAPNNQFDRTNAIV